MRLTNPDYIAGIESSGFISALAFKNGIGFITIRKHNKLAGKIIGINYKVNTGEDRLESKEHLLKKILK